MGAMVVYSQKKIAMKRVHTTQQPHRRTIGEGLRNTSAHTHNRRGVTCTPPSSTSLAPGWSAAWAGNGSPTSQRTADCSSASAFACFFCYEL